MISNQWLRRLFWFPTLLIFTSLISVSGQFASNSQLSFNLAPRFDIGYSTTRTTVADFDGDGFKDTISVNEGDFDDGITAEIRILFGNGSGGFDAELSIPYFHGTFPIAAGDLNNDGKPDFVTAGWTYNTISVHLNLGNRQFAAPRHAFPQLLPSPNAVNGMFWGLEIADFDGDGTNDVVALQGQTNQHLRFFRCNSTGDLTEFSWTRQFQNNASYHAKIAVGDINNDNRSDVVFFSGNVGNQRIDFVFGQPPGTPMTLSYGMDVFDEAVGISVKDLDNDGDKDMAVAFLDTTTPSQNYLQVFRNNGSGGFTPLPKMFFGYLFPPDDITTADFTGDGKQDIAALISSSIVMTVNGLGDCTFTGEKYYAVSPSDAIFSADLNQDSKQDILTQQNVGLVYNYASVLINNNPLGFKALPVTLWGGSFIDAGDFNGDGYKDLATAWGSYFNATSTIDLLINDRAGSFTNEEDFYETPRGLNDMKTGDFNGDGKSDVVSIHTDSLLRALAVYPGSGNGTIGAAITTQLNASLLNVVVGNFNSDGKDDVFVIDSLANGYSMLANGDGTFSVAPGSPVTLPDNVPFKLQKGDFNRDNKIDLIISMNSEVKLWLGDGAGRFTQSSAVIAPMENAVPGDFNGDGKLDLAGTTNTGISGALGDGSGGFGAPFSRAIPGIYATANGGSIVVADFDLDGFDDVAMVMPDNDIGNLIIIPSGGSAPSWGQPIFYGLGAAQKIVAADFNSDGKPDIGYLGGNTRGVIYNTTGGMGNSAPFDFDGDGKTDIGIYRPNVGEWWLNRSSNGSTFAAQFGSSSDKLAPADFTGDGKTDIAVFRPSTGEWFILRSENQSYYSFPFGTSGDIPAAGDFDGDDKADASVFRPSDATWYISKSTGGTLIQQFGQTGDVPVVADYDGDNKSDIAIYRVASGEWWIQRSTAGLIAFQFGNSSDKPAPGDYTGDGKADIALFRPVTGEWFVLRSEDQSYYSFPFGTSGDIPAPGDYDGDGKIDATVFRPSNNTWYSQRTTAGTLIQSFGQNGDAPVPNAFIP